MSRRERYTDKQLADDQKTLKDAPRFDDGRPCLKLHRTIERNVKAGLEDRGKKYEGEWKSLKEEKPFRNECWPTDRLD